MGGKEKIADQAMSLVLSLDRAYRRLDRPADALPRAGGARNFNSGDLQIINKYKISSRTSYAQRTAILVPVLQALTCTCTGSY
eukprot:SAG31_NODE_1262_length_9072_cov_11.697760_6_plen_83_part_00